MNEPGDLFRFLAVNRQEWQRHQLLKSLGYLDPADDDFGLNKWTQLLYVERSDEEYRMQEFPQHEPKHLVSLLAVPNDFMELDLDVETKAFREWLASLKWEYCSVLESPFRHSRPQACGDGIFLPYWLNSETRSVLERFLVIRRNGVAEFGLGGEVYYRQQETSVFKLIHIASRIWQFAGFYSELYSRFPLERQSGITFWVNIRGTRNALLGNLAEGWKEPRPGFPEAYNPRCIDKHLQFSRVTDARTLGNDVDSLVRWSATRIDNAWGQFQPRCYVHANVEETQPFARPTLRR